MKNKGKRFIASIEEHSKDKIKEIAENLRQKGCKINDVLSFSGIITGESSGNEKSLEELKVKGIKYIEEDGEVRAL
jgi:hypothetical protein